MRPRVSLPGLNLCRRFFCLLLAVLAIGTQIGDRSLASERLSRVLSHRMADALALCGTAHRVDAVAPVAPRPDHAAHLVWVMPAPFDAAEPLLPDARPLPHRTVRAQGMAAPRFPGTGASGRERLPPYPRGPPPVG